MRLLRVCRGVCGGNDHGRPGDPIAGGAELECQAAFENGNVDLEPVEVDIHVRAVEVAAQAELFGSVERCMEACDVSDLEVQDGEVSFGTVARDGGGHSVDDKAPPTQPHEITSGYPQAVGQRVGLAKAHGREVDILTTIYAEDPSDHAAECFRATETALSLQANLSATSSPRHLISEWDATAQHRSSSLPARESQLRAQRVHPRKPGLWPQSETACQWGYACYPRWPRDSLGSIAVESELLEPRFRYPGKNAG